MRNRKSVNILVVTIISLYFLFSFINSAFGFSNGTNSIQTSQQTAKYVSKLDRKIENNAFKVGEKLNFVIKWGPMIAGHATLEVRDLVDLGNHKAYNIVSEAKSSQFFDVFYKVRDTISSYTDCEGLYSWRFEKHVKEGKYRHNELILYDQEKHFATHNGNVLEIPPYVQDILSAFYYVRTQELEIGQEIKIPVNAGDKNYELIVKVLGREQIKVPKGKFKTILIEPLVKYGGIFQHKGKLLIWLTDDERKIPVLMRSKIAVGSIDAELIDVDLP